MRVFRNHWRLMAAAAALLAGVALLFALYQTGAWVPNAAAAERYAVRGVDVSAYQGTVDWARLSAQSVRFAFLKATEGAGFQDGRFAQNWQGARKAGIKTGAYHFFNFDVDAAAQAENFIRAVPAESDMLPPVVDLEFYGRYKSSHPAQAEVRAALDTLLAKLQARYGKAPILYCTGDSYHTYVRDAYAANPVWIRSVVTPPAAPQNWTFWQYTDKGRLKGYSGKEPSIDLDVFNGTEQALDRL